MVQIGFKCNKGVVRKNNEDACFVIPSQDVYIVADGVGGNRSGEVASRTAVSEIADFVNKGSLSQHESPEDIFEFFYEAIEHANDSIYHMGISNIGDSRAYLFRDGELKQITSDHTYVNELIDRGVITEEEAEYHKQKNVITKALGTPQLAEPDFYKMGVSKGDILMLCSDGLYGEVSQKIMETILGSGVSMNDACAQMVDEAIKRGGRDNITVVCIKI